MIYCRYFDLEILTKGCLCKVHKATFLIKIQRRVVTVEKVINDDCFGQEFMHSSNVIRAINSLYLNFFTISALLKLLIYFLLGI